MKKRNVILALMVLLSLGISTVMLGQTHRKRKKKKHTTEQSSAEADSIAAAKTRDSLAMIAAATPAAAPIDTGHTLTDGLVADTTSFNMNLVDLDTTKPIDGFYRMKLLTGAKPFAFPNENKWNIKFYKRIWRNIDLTDSVNRIFSVPGQTLIQLIMDAIKAQKLVAYADEGFTKALSYEKVQRRLSDSTVVPDIDSTGTQYGSHMVFNPFNPDSVVLLELKEDVFVDKARGRLITQIIGLAPIKREKGSTGEYIGISHPFYLYFPQCRNVFAAKEAFDTQRDVYDQSYDDLFLQRSFKSVIVKESNPGDFWIRDKYPNDEKMQKREAERIERDLREYPRKLWKY